MVNLDRFTDVIGKGLLSSMTAQYRQPGESARQIQQICVHAV